MRDIETRKFPNGGYDVIIVKKDDILDTIEQNIIDREIMDEIISQLEVNVTTLLKEEKWTGVPFLGNIRIPPVKKMALKRKDLQKDVYENESRETYLMFIRQNALDDDKIVRANRMYRRIASIAIRKDVKRFRDIAKVNGETYARLYMYFKFMIKSIDNELLIIEELNDNT